MTRALESKAEKIAHLRQRIAQIPARSVTAPDPSPVIATPRRTHPEESPAALASAPALGTLPTPAPIADLLPHHGLVRGSTVQVSGAAALRVGLVASVTGAGGWAAIVGRPKFGLLAAAEMGADLARCAIIPDAGDDPAAVAAVLVDGVDVVLLSLGGADVPPSRARAVTARARSVDRTTARHAYVHDSAAPINAVDISGTEGGGGSVRNGGSQDRGSGGCSLGSRKAS